jgi:hypothetical protein
VVDVWNNSTGGVWQNDVAAGSLYQGPTGPTPSLALLYEWLSVGGVEPTDPGGTNIPGIRMVDGPFIGFRANFNFKTTLGGGGGTVVAPPTTSPDVDLGGGCSIGSNGAGNKAGWTLVGMVLAGLGIRMRQRRRSLQ